MRGSLLLDVYVLRRFVFSLLVSLTGLLLITIVVDLTGNIDTFIDFQASPRAIALYYLYRLPYWTVLVLPVAALLGTLFALNSLARTSEVTAMKALGISLYRILMPVFACGVITSLLAFVLTDRIVPAATYRFNLVRDQITAYRRPDGSRRQLLLQDVDGQLIFARSYDAAQERASNVTYESRNGHRIAVRANARAMEWRTDSWVLLDGVLWSVTDGEAGGDEESATGGEAGGEVANVDEEAAGAARDALTATEFDSLRLTRLTLLPEDLGRLQKTPEEMSYAELRRYIDRAIANGEDATRHLVDLHLKLSFPLTCFIIVVLGAPIGANARRTGMANSLGLGTMVCFVFYSSVKAGQALGWNQVISPWAGAWGTNIIFGILSLLLLRLAHK